MLAVGSTFCGWILSQTVRWVYDEAVCCMYFCVEKWSVKMTYPL